MGIMINITTRQYLYIMKLKLDLNIGNGYLDGEAAY